MAKKKNTQIAVSQEDNTQAQHILEQYREIAGNLHTSTDQEHAEDALTEINNMPEGAQIALLKALSKELHTDAADVLIAINELSPIKSVRKEARRSLIRLEGVRIYPQWKPPVQPAVVVQVTDAPLRFWKGIVTDTFPTGEVELLLLFRLRLLPGLPLLPRLARGLRGHRGAAASSGNDLGDPDTPAGGLILRHSVGEVFQPVVLGESLGF